MQPHIMTELPPCFMVCLTCLSFRLPASLDQYQDLPSEQKRLILVSSGLITRFQSSTVQSLCALAKPSLAFMFLADSISFFCFSADLIPACLSALATVNRLTATPTSSMSFYETPIAVSACPEA